MQTAQPALIYLIPFTIAPIIILALIRREFKLLWFGEFSKPEVTNITKHKKKNQNFIYSRVIIGIF